MIWKHIIAPKHICLYNLFYIFAHIICFEEKTTATTWVQNSDSFLLLIFKQMEQSLEYSYLPSNYLYLLPGYVNCRNLNVFCGYF